MRKKSGLIPMAIGIEQAIELVPEEKPNIDTMQKQKQAPETNKERFKRLTGVDLCQCRVCKTGRMVSKRELPRIRSPVWFQNKQAKTQY